MPGAAIVDYFILYIPLEIMIRFHSHRYQFLLGVLLLLVAVILVRNAAHTLHANRATALRIPQSVIQGTHTWSLRNESFCFAELKTKLAIVDDALTLSIDAAGLVSLQGKRNKLFATGFIQFNSLHQVFSTLFNFGSELKQWQLGSAGVTPIRWTFKSHGVATEPVQYEGTVPGPIMMSPDTTLHYEITYPLVIPGSFWSDDNAASVLFKNNTVKIEAAPCTETQMGALPVDALIKRLETFRQKISLFTT